MQTFDHARSISAHIFDLTSSAVPFAFPLSSDALPLASPANSEAFPLASPVTSAVVPSAWPVAALVLLEMVSSRARCQLVQSQLHRIQRHCLLNSFENASRTKNRMPATAGVTMAKLTIYIPAASIPFKAAPDTAWSTFFAASATVSVALFWLRRVVEKKAARGTV